MKKYFKWLKYFLIVKYKIDNLESIIKNKDIEITRLQDLLYKARSKFRRYSEVEVNQLLSMKPYEGNDLDIKYFIIKTNFNFTDVKEISHEQYTLLIPEINRELDIICK